MPGRTGSKLKLIKLIEIFQRKTDENHVLNANELIDELAKQGVICERKSIYDDIRLLNENGFDIMNTRTPKNGYYLASREFEIAEVRLIVDAIQAADFITNRKTNQLTEKLRVLVSDNEFDAIKNQVGFSQRVKCSNEEIYYTIDALNRAIEDKKRVHFEYVRHKIKGKNIVAEEKEFTVNPYALIWSDDHYYLVSNNPKYTNLMHTRLDRMKRVEITDEDADSFENYTDYKDTFDVADYADKMFSMFSGNVSEITIVCDNSLLEEIYDRFGSNVRITNEDVSNFVFSAEAAISEGLVSWIMQYGQRMYVRSPESLKKMITNRAENIMKIYSEENC